MTNDDQLKRFDEWLIDGSTIAALVIRQWLKSVEGDEAIVFPPTYAKPERMRDEDWLGYNIDRLGGDSNVCLMDSVGSQANRMEPLFKKHRYSALVPQVIIDAGGEVNLLDAGHRVADAVVRFSELSDELHRALLDFKNNGNAGPLAKIAPTSFVFGAWDSRATQVKLSRIVRSVIYAFNVSPIHRSAVYAPAIDYVEKGIDRPSGKAQKDAMSQLGLLHALASWTHGGVTAQGDIRRDATLNLVPLRALGALPPEASLKLRRYILGLSLVSLTAPQEMFLREGCLLIPDMERSAEYNIVKHSGERQPFSISHEDALVYAEQAASNFVVGSPRRAQFNFKRAKDELGRSKEERKKARRGEGPDSKNPEEM